MEVLNLDRSVDRDILSSESSESLAFGPGKDLATPGCRAASSLTEIVGVKDRALLFIFD